MGATGEPDASRRFFRFAFIVRFALVAPTPLFFWLPGTQYRGGAAEWGVWGVLMAWSAFLAVLTYRNDEWMKRTDAIYVADLIVVFVAFGAMTHAQPTHGAHISYSDVVIAGAFQLQTYGAALTAGALRGAPAGLLVGGCSTLLYLVVLGAIDGSFTDVFDRSHVQGTVTRGLMYVIIGFNFGLYNTLVGRLVHRVRSTLTSTVRVHVYDDLHKRGLNRLDAIRQLAEEAAEIEVTDLEQQDRLARIVDSIRFVNESLRREPLGEAASVGLQEVREAVAEACLFNRRARTAKRPLVMHMNEDESPFWISVKEAAELSHAVAELVINAGKYSHEGPIHVVARRTDSEYIVSVTDPGPASTRSGTQRGIAQIERAAESYGWTYTWREGKDGGRSEAVIALKDETVAAPEAPASDNRLALWGQRVGEVSARLRRSS